MDLQTLDAISTDLRDIEGLASLIQHTVDEGGKLFPAQAVALANSIQACVNGIRSTLKQAHEDASEHARRVLGPP